MTTVLDRFKRPTPAATGDFSGASPVEPAFFADFMCTMGAVPPSSGYSPGTIMVATNRADGAHPAAASWVSSWCASGDVRTGDFNGDRRVDVFCYDSAAATVKIALSDGASFVPQSVTALGSVYCSGTGVVLTTGDVNGDGRDDLICHAPSGGYTWVALAKPSGDSFEAAAEWKRNWCQYANTEFFVGDYDGDGMADLLCHFAAGSGAPGATWVALSKGHPSTVTEEGFVEPYDGAPWMTGWCHWSGTKFGVADVNGDGLVDAYCHDGPGGHLWVSFSRGERPLEGGVRGPGFRSAVTVNTDYTALAGFCTTGSFGMADVDGDGRADAFCHDSSGTTVSLAAFRVEGGYVPSSPPTPHWYCDTRETDPNAAKVKWQFGTPTSILPGWCTAPYQKFSSAR